MDKTPPAKTRIFLNPVFGKAHINPKFLKVPVPESIHVNPNFLTKFKTPQPVPVPSPPQQGKIITKSRTKLIRAKSVSPRTDNQTSLCSNAELKSARSPLIKIGNRKLVRASIMQRKYDQISPLPAKLIRTPVVPAKNNYKVDRRPPKLKGRRLASKSFVSKYALSRVAERELLSPRKVSKAGRRVCKLETTLKKGKFLLNINGVLYKSSKTKLEKAASPAQTSSHQLAKTSHPKQQVRDRFLFVRGNKFVLDKSGHSLTRVGTQCTDPLRIRRIDIGGLTYVADSQDKFVRTNNHTTRNYLSCAKQKSINCLSKRLTKTNVPCPIFRKVGKCAAYESGKCPKVHDKKQVSICPKFLKGECVSEKCLLSHDVSLSKMPTCKFFLQGCCTRIPCPYLHKKLNDKTEICIEFLRGFCNLAEKCDKRHEFQCPDFGSKGTCEKLRCPYMHRKHSKTKGAETCNRPEENTRAIGETSTRATAIKRSTKDTPEESTTEKSASRYFEGTSARHRTVSAESGTTSKDNDSENQVPTITTLSKRPKLGDLPAFIPL